MNTKPDLPEIIIIGAQKCGTSSLNWSLKAHSEIYGAKDPETGKPVKEVDFFYDNEKLKKGIDWYRSHFVGATGTCLDASPNYFPLTQCYGHMKELMPDAKIIISLRNPIYRAFSQYNHNTHELPLSETWDWFYKKSFLENIEAELSYLSENIDNITNFSGIVSRGIYIKQINQLLLHFNRADIYFTIMDFWPTTYESELINIQKFLKKKIEILPTDIKHKRLYTTEPLSVKAKSILKDFYRPYNQQLFDLLGFEIPEWNC
jgi:hypothetical protein